MGRVVEARRKDGWDGPGAGDGGGFEYGCRTPGSSCRMWPEYYLPCWENHRGSAYAVKLKWDGQETSEAISALHGICIKVFI